MSKQIAAVLALLVLASSIVLVWPVAAAGPTCGTACVWVQGRVTDAGTGAPLAGVCVWFGPVHIDRSVPTTNCVFTDATGTFGHDFIRGSFTLPLTFEKDPTYLQATLNVVPDHDPVIADQALTVRPPAGGGGGAAPLPAPTPAPSGPCTTPGLPTMTLYLPNITKTLGGPTGWQTPFIVQNVGSTAADLEISFYRFSDGSLVTCRIVHGLQPGTSFADVPNNDLDLPDDGQFAVVVRAFGAKVVSVVNEHRGVGSRAEALSYVAPAVGAATLVVPWVAKQAGGWLTTLIIQNMGSVRTTVDISAIAFDGQTTTSLSRTIEPGRSQYIDPRSEGALKDGYEYSFQLLATQPLAVVVNAHHDDVSVVAPMAMSYDGSQMRYASTAFLPYVAKSSTGRTSRVIVQNLSTVTLAPTFVFHVGAGPDVTYVAPTTIRPFASWPLDLSIVPGLGEGEFSAEIRGAPFAVVVGTTDATSAMAYATSVEPANRLYLPNVTRTLGGPAGWTTPFSLQSAGAGTATVSWYRFSDGARVLTQTLAGWTLGSGRRIDPRDLGGLEDDRQYAVVVDADGPVTAVVTELSFAGGDGAMAYEGIPSP